MNVGLPLQLQPQFQQQQLLLQQQQLLQGQALQPLQPLPPLQAPPLPPLQAPPLQPLQPAPPLQLPPPQFSPGPQQPPLDHQQQQQQLQSQAEKVVQSLEQEQKKRASHTGSGTRFSGAPLWRFTLRNKEEKTSQPEQETPRGPPDGFVQHHGAMWKHPEQNLYWSTSSRKYFLLDAMTRAYSELKEEVLYDANLRFSVDASGANRPDGTKDDRKVIVRDLVKAAQSLKMPVDHLPRPVSLFAVYSGHRPMQSDGSPAAEESAAPLCSEFCARSLHLKLLARLSAYRGPWSDSAVTHALQQSFEEVDADFLAKQPGATDGCSAAVALLIGQRLFTANVGDTAGFVALDTGSERWQVFRQSRGHLPGNPADLERLMQAGGAVAPVGPGAVPMVNATSGDRRLCLPVCRAFGDRLFKLNGPTTSVIIATPEVRALSLRPEHRCIVLSSSEVADLVPSNQMSELLKLRLGKPRMASGGLVEAAKVKLKEKPSLLPRSCTALTIFLDWSQGGQEATPSAPSQPPAKKAKLGDAAAKEGSKTQVRCRMILVKHKDCKEPVDHARGKKAVTRPLEEAEQLLRKVQIAIEGSPGRSIFTQQCKAVSEDPSCLKGGEMAGDLGWVSRGQTPPAVEAAIFALPIGHMSDIVESDEGVHLLWRIA
eukprot:TRINITY_DN113106_c0_g1_i1.p1 TRINITY_DN113106_c0_g1~~TRINITY_DN113106_c0_g1_i1.p1  ORF type:complete len:655 (-),score=182.88 TRINITY_DN113106_c0_g1_i1:109-2073(-)